MHFRGHHHRILQQVLRRAKRQADYRDYLLTAHSLKHTDRPLNRNSASAYWGVFRSLLKQAHRDKYLRENINDYLDRIEENEVKKEYLTPEELKHLATTPCKIPVLKSASLFSCLTGLRISDILNLKWEHIQKAPEGGYCIRIRTQKTQTEATLPISMEAYELLWRTWHWHSLQGIQAQHGTTPVEGMAEICWNHQIDVEINTLSASKASNALLADYI